MRADVVDCTADERIPHPPIRIRTVLLLILLGTLAYRVYPRAVAAWELHGMATTVADYALCMVGPTGPALIRDNPHQFSKLVRRRLVAAPFDSRPFAECVSLAETLTHSDDALRAHRAQAFEFSEYGAPGAEERSLTLMQLGVSTEPLAEMSRHAWPFVRGGYARLVKASVSATEAVHPVAPPKPAVGSGLPNWRARYRAVHKTQAGFVVAFGQGANLSAYETNDLGVSWKPVGTRDQSSDFLERCPIDEDGRSFTFALSDDGRSIIVNSLGPDGAPYGTVLGAADKRVLSAACDADGMVVALTSGKVDGMELELCPFRRSCRKMKLPEPRMQAALLTTDVARVQGTTVLAMSSGGIVRVASSRDGGRTWTPLSVAYDAAEHPRAAMGLAAPDRLLALEDRLLLYGGGERQDQAYLVLLSEDHGASWRTP